MAGMHEKALRLSLGAFFAMQVGAYEHENMLYPALIFDKVILQIGKNQSSQADDTAK